MGTNTHMFLENGLITFFVQPPREFKKQEIGVGGGTRERGTPSQTQFGHVGLWL